jgi:N-acetylglucosaminyldiphosphoundecaprenol N-acetyl-beta-D-mannosaminyltransferase
MKTVTFEMGHLKCSSHTIPQLLQEVRMLLHDRSAQPRTILCVNAHIYNLAFTDLALREALNSARIVTADGMGIVLAARFFGNRIEERCNFTEAFRAFLECEDMPPSRAVLLGITQPEAERVASYIERASRHCRVVETRSGFLADSDYERVLVSHRDVDFVFIGMGSPKSERIAMLAAKLCPSSIVWAIGGGTMRIMAGTIKEAPLVMRRYGLQWVHRLFMEPTLWRRYLFGNPLFLMRAFQNARKQRRKSG